MGSGQSGEREVTVEERAGDDGQPQIIVKQLLLVRQENHCILLLQVTQAFLQYVQGKQEGEGEGARPLPPPPYSGSEESDIPHLTTDDMVSVCVCVCVCVCVVRDGV